MDVALLVGLFAAVMILVERWRPARAFPRVPGFVARAALLNGLQVASVFVLGTHVDAWLQSHRPWSAASLGTFGGAALGYLVITFVYYWWHRARHTSDFLWRWVHQVHHSPQRLEILTSFYKHPIEIAINAVLSSAILYGLVGVTPAAGAWAVAITGVAELVYHWNVRTPRWLGWWFQRPEMHCVHHEKGRHHGNYADLPLWDILFGTFDNPATFDGRCGFADDAERRLPEMLRGVDVHRPRPKRRWDRASTATAIVLTLGLGRMAADTVGLGKVGGLLAATGASPAPKVFTAYGDVEPFSTQVTLSWRDPEGNAQQLPLTSEVYARLRGPYNRRNPYGAVVVFAPVAARRPELAGMFDAVAQSALCGERRLLSELGVDPGSVGSELTIVYTPREGAAAIEPVTVRCAEEVARG